METQVFRETQKFRQVLLWLVVWAVPVYSLYSYLHYKKLTFLLQNPLTLTLIILPFLIPIFFNLAKLETSYDENGITYRFFPFHLKEKTINWNLIKEAYIRKYEPLNEYGGWGVRNGWSNGKAYNVSGNKGLQLILNNGDKLLLGTQKPKELDLFLLHLGKRTKEPVDL